MKKINRKFYQLIGLSKRAGKLVSGATAVENSIKTGNARLVIISEEASSHTSQRFYNMCKYGGIDIIKIGNREALGECIGKPDRTLIAITDMAFKAMILDVLPSSITNAGVID